MVRMVRACICCKYKVNKAESDVSLYGFPKDKVLREKWINILGVKDKLCGSARLCSRHFKEDDFRYSLVGGNRFLKRGALPSLYLDGQFEDNESLDSTSTVVDDATKLITDEPIVQEKDIFIDNPYTLQSLAEGEESVSYEFISDAQRTSHENEIPDPQNQIIKNQKRNIDDVGWDEISRSPAQAKIYWEVAVEKIRRQKTIIKTFKQKVRRLRTKVSDLRILLKDLTEKQLVKYVE